MFPAPEDRTSRRNRPENRTMTIPYPHLCTVSGWICSVSMEASKRLWTRQAGVLQAGHGAPLKDGQCPKVIILGWQSPFHLRLHFPGSASDPGTTEPLPALLPSSLPVGLAGISSPPVPSQLKSKTEATLWMDGVGQNFWAGLADSRRGRLLASPELEEEQSVIWTPVRKQNRDYSALTFTWLG